MSQLEYYEMYICNQNLSVTVGQLIGYYVYFVDHSSNSGENNLIQGLVFLF